MNFSANLSGMVISSTEEELSEDGGDSGNGNRKHIIYQNCLGELLMKVNTSIGYIMMTALLFHRYI